MAEEDGPLTQTALPADASPATGTGAKEGAAQGAPAARLILQGAQLPDELPAPAPSSAGETAAPANPPASTTRATAAGSGTTTPPAPRRGGFVTPLLGGALAFALGFAAAHYNLLELAGVSGTADLDSRLTELENALGAQKAAIDAASARAEAAARAAQLPEELAALPARVAALEETQAQAGSTDGVPASLRAEVEALKAAVARATSPTVDGGDLRAMVQAEMAKWQQDQAAEAEARAKEKAEEAVRAAAFATLQEAVASGAPYDAALEALGLAQVPEALSRHAAGGLPTVADLAASFPDAARAALAAVPSGGDFWAFLRRQTGARSLTPQEGDSPDAVLSRAEAAAVAGDLARAVEELAALPPEAGAAMAPWIAEAREVLAAEAALAALPAPQSP